MKRFIALALLISLSVPAYSAEKAPVLKAGAEQSKVKKVKPQKNKYEYINLAWWQQFNDEYLNDYIIQAMEKNKDLKIATLTIDEYYQNVIAQRAGELPSLQAGFMPGYSKIIGPSQGGFGLPIFQATSWISGGKIITKQLL